MFSKQAVVLDVHDEIREKLKRIYQEFYPPVLLDGQPGAGKTFLAKRVAQELGYDLIEVNASMNTTQAQIDRLKDIASIQRDEPTVLLLDEIESTFTSEEIADLVDFVAMNGRANKIMLVATANNAWRLSNAIREKFSVIKLRQPTLREVRSALKKARVSLDGQFITRDLRQLVRSIELQKRGILPRESTDATFAVSFSTVSDFVAGSIEKRQNIMDDGKLYRLRPAIEKWLVYNALAETIMKKHTIEWHETLELLSLYDALGRNKNVLLTLPRFSIGFGELKHPTQLFRQGKNQ